MPTFTFDGFTKSSLSATQRAAGSVPEWRLSNMNTATIDFTSHTHAEVVAPAGVWFDAGRYSGFAVSEDTDRFNYDPSAHEIFHFWDFDDPGTFETALNMPTIWNNKGVDYGKRAYHVFDTPGTYNVRLWAVDAMGTTGERLAQVTVLDPATVYSGTRTICVSNKNDFTEAPAGAQQVTSILAAKTALEALGQSGRILLRRGEAHTEQFTITDAMSNVHIGVFGSGPKPVWRAGSSACIIASGTSALPSDIMIWGIRFEGEWDAAKETGEGRGQAILTDGLSPVAYFSLVTYQCEIDGLSGYFPHSRLTADGNGYRNAIVDCDITNWRDYGVAQFDGTSGLSSHIAIVGTAIHQKENACRNGQGKNGLGNDHNPIRISGVRQLIISTCDFFTANAWTPQGGTQPAARLFMAGPGNPGGWYLNANRWALEGGGDIIALDGYAREIEERPGNHIFDMVLLVADYSTNRAMKLSHGGTTVRNALAIFPNVTRRIGPRLGAYGAPRSASNVTNDTAKWTISHCTTLNLLEDGEAAPGNISSEAYSLSDHTYTDNVEHQPFAGITPDAPVDLSQVLAGFRTRNRGLRKSVEKVSADPGRIPSGGSFTVGYPSGTSATDFSPSGRHTVKVGSINSTGGEFYYSYKGQCALAFGASEITVTNTSGVSWNEQVRLGLDQDTLTTDAAYETSPTVPLPVPTAMSAALLSNGMPWPYTQFDTGLRVRARGAV